MYNFKEANLGKDFAKEKLADFKELIEEGRSFVVLSMPRVGVSYFLRYLATQDFAKFFQIDLYSLSTLNQHEFYKLLLIELGGKAGNKTEQQLLMEIKKILKDIPRKEEK